MRAPYNTYIIKATCTMHMVAEVGAHSEEEARKMVEEDGGFFDTYGNDVFNITSVEIEEDTE